MIHRKPPERRHTVGVYADLEKLLVSNTPEARQAWLGRLDDGKTGPYTEKEMKEILAWSKQRYRAHASAAQLQHDVRTLYARVFTNCVYPDAAAAAAMEWNDWAQLAREGCGVRKPSRNPERLKRQVKLQAEEAPLPMLLNLPLQDQSIERLRLLYAELSGAPPDSHIRKHWHHTDRGRMNRAAERGKLAHTKRAVLALLREEMVVQLLRAHQADRQIPMPRTVTDFAMGMAPVTLDNFAAPPPPPLTRADVAERVPERLEDLRVLHAVQALELWHGRVQLAVLRLARAKLLKSKVFDTAADADAEAHPSLFTTVWQYLNDAVTAAQQSGEAAHVTDALAFAAGLVLAMDSAFGVEADDRTVVGKSFARYHKAGNYAALLELLQQQDPVPYHDIDASRAALRTRGNELKTQSPAYFKRGVRMWRRWFQDQDESPKPSDLPSPDEDGGGGGGGGGHGNNDDDDDGDDDMDHKHGGDDDDDDDVDMALDTQDSGDPFVPHDDDEQEALDVHAAQGLTQLVASGMPGEVVAPPPTVWSGTTDEHTALVRRLVQEIARGEPGAARRARNATSVANFDAPGPVEGLAQSDEEVYHTQGYYSRGFSMPQPWVLAANDRLTQAVVARIPGLSELMVRAVERLQDALAPLKSNVRVRVKGSRGINMVIQGSMHNAGAYEPREALDDVKTMADRLFAGSDMDVDVQVNPALPQDEFDALHRTCVAASADCVVWFKREVQKLAAYRQHLQQAAAVLGPTGKADDRRSFVIHRLFRETEENQQAPGTPGWGNLVMFTEVNSVVGMRKQRHKLVTTPLYVSYNELRFQNGQYHSHFKLLRCMVSFTADGPAGSGKRRRLHAELLDIAVPERDDALMLKKWNEHYVNIPQTRLRTLSLAVQVGDMLNAMTNSQQRHKLLKRQRRLEGFRRLFCAMEDARIVDLDKGGVFAGLKFEELEDRCRAYTHMNSVSCAEHEGKKREQLVEVLMGPGYFDASNAHSISSNGLRRTLRKIPKQTLCDIIAVLSARANAMTFQQKRTLLARVLLLYSVARGNGFLFWRLKRTEIDDIATQGSIYQDPVQPVGLPEDEGAQHSMADHP